MSEQTTSTNVGVADHACASRPTRKEHTLKCWPEFFTAILADQKTHDLRRNDRNFQVGDLLHLQEFNPKSGKYTGRAVDVRVTYVTKAGLPCALSEEALHPGFCILSISRLR